jgi:hypothetical protein
MNCKFADKTFQRGYGMLKNIICSFFLFFFMFLQNACGGSGEGLREQERMLENYEDVKIIALIDTIKKDLLSEDALLQDAGCIILMKTLERLKEGDRKAEFIFIQLSGDKKVVGIAADIIDSRLLGWYNREKPEENDDDIKIYTPLFQILGKADDKTARGTLVRSFLFLYGRKDILKGIQMNEELVTISLKRLEILKEKLCCVYPGRDCVIDMLEKDSRLGMLDIFESLLMANKKLSEKMKNEIKEFVIGCMEYGDLKNGSLIRIKAAAIAGILVKGGEKDLARKIEDLSKNDQYYVHKYDGKTGYSLTELKYPVREISLKILLR